MSLWSHLSLCWWLKGGGRPDSLQMRSSNQKGKNWGWGVGNISIFSPWSLSISNWWRGLETGYKNSLTGDRGHLGWLLYILLYITTILYWCGMPRQNMGTLCHIPCPLNLFLLLYYVPVNIFSQVLQVVLADTWGRCEGPQYLQLNGNVSSLSTPLTAGI